MNQVKIFSIVIVLLVIGVLALAVTRSPGEDIQSSTKYDAFAQCLADSGTIFYGAFWCPHCNNQKKMFGASAKLLPYVECSLPNAQGQTQECIDKGIDGYPTWEFPDGSRENGEVPLEVLSEKTGCELPLGDVAPVVSPGEASAVE